jgi:glycosyltransferase involved in cell wall biosynthesis
VGKPIFFSIVIPSYNNEQWCIRNLESCLNQTYPYFIIYYIDDCSQDSTGKLVDAYVKSHKLEKKCIVIHNKERHGALENIYNTIQTIPSYRVVVLVDGDDFLAHPNVLEKLVSVYRDGKIWMTYGDFKSEPEGYPSPCRKIPSKIAKHNSFRSYSWVASHLRTFYAGLFQKIKKEDLQYEGKFLPVSWDLAMMMPMLEMSSRAHFRFIPEVLYIYNVHNPLNDFRERHELQIKLNYYIRGKTPYTPLETLFEVY